MARKKKSKSIDTPKPLLALPPPKKLSIEENFSGGEILIHDKPLMLRCFKAGVKGCEKLIKLIKETWPDGKEKSMAILSHSTKRQEYLDKISSLEKED
jgi:hypothetical protein